MRKANKLARRSQLEQKIDILKCIEKRGHVRPTRLSGYANICYNVLIPMLNILKKNGLINNERTPNNRWITIKQAGIFAVSDYDSLVKRLT